MEMLYTEKSPTWTVERAGFYAFPLHEAIAKIYIPYRRGETQMGILFMGIFMAINMEFGGSGRNR